MSKKLNVYGRSLRWIDIKIKNHWINYLILKNVFHTHYAKNVLILYIAGPFYDINWTHTNQQIAIGIAQTFKKKGYNVDIAQYKVKRNINFHKYDVVFGFGEQFDRLLRRYKDYTSTQTIAFLTGASAYFANLAELNRMVYFRDRNGISLKLRRQDHELDGLMDLDALQHVTAAVCTGNEWTVGTWKNMIKNIYQITATGFNSVKLPDVNRKINEAKKNFLWFSGAGMLHKGLDICIEAFRETPNLNLYVAGTMDPDFYDFYEDDFQHRNIHYCGFVDIKSDVYKELCSECLFCIFPSCSEGMATSVLTTMFSGMIPVVTKETGIDIQDWGIEIVEPNVEYITDLAKKLSNIEDNQLKNREVQAYEYAMKNHTLEKFCEDFGMILDKVLEKK